MPDVIEPMDVITKKRYVADWLREMVVSGDLPAGQRLRQRELAQRLGVSPTPVREAMHQLEIEGYLENIPHVGVQVVEVASEHREEVARLRKLLEGQLSRIAADRITADQAHELKALQQAFEDAVERSDARTARRTNYQLHRFIWSVTGQTVTQQIVQGLWARVPWRSLDDVAERGGQSAAEHANLVSAILSRDPDAAQQATERHIASSEAYLLRIRQSPPARPTEPSEAE